MSVAYCCELQGGDFLDTLPTGGALYLLARILLDHEDEGCVRLLRHCRQAMADGGRVHLIQWLLPSSVEGVAHHLLFDGAMSNLNRVMLGLGELLDCPPVL